MKKILFVCTGNTCRSAMAVYLAAALAEQNYPNGTFCFDSAGLCAAPGAPASDEATAALAELGIDMTAHRAKAFSPYMIDKADLILTMTDNHRRHLLAACPEAEGKVFALSDYTGDTGDIPDPWGGSLAEYEQTRNRLTEIIAKLLKKIDAEQENNATM